MGTATRIARRRVLRWLAAAPIPAALLAAGCGGASGDGGAVVAIGTPNKAGLPSTPTPIPTPAVPPELVLSAERIYQAGAVLVSLVSASQDAVGGSVSFLGRSYPLTKGARSIYAFCAAGPDDPAGVQPLKVDFTLKSGSKGALNSSVEVLKTVWTRDAITVGPNLAPLLDDRLSNAELQQLALVYGAVTNEKYWDMGWMLPANGDITTRFGEQRSYNGGPVTGHHLGTDIGVARGAPVAATNRGRVAMARQMQLRGNMVVLDHGGGLFSGYAHLDSFAVAEGQFVNKGDLIGQVGSTGLSTGAHLHWEMAVGGVLVDAFRFTDGSNGF